MTATITHRPDHYDAFLVEFSTGEAPEELHYLSDAYRFAEGMGASEIILINWSN